MEDSEPWTEGGIVIKWAAQRRFRGGLVVKVHRLVYDSTLGWRVIKKG